MTTLSVLALMPENEGELQSFTSDLKGRILNGEISPQRLLYQKKQIENMISAVFDDKEVNKHLQDEIEKYGKEGIAFGNLKFELGTRRKWDYSNTGDTVLLKMKAEYDNISDKLKQREAFLKSAKKPFADIETGEVVYPASCEITTFIKSTKI